MSPERKTKLIPRSEFPFRIRLDADSRQHNCMTIEKGTIFDYSKMNTYLIADGARVCYYEARRVVKGIVEVYNFESSVVEILEML